MAAVDAGPVQPVVDAGDNSDNDAGLVCVSTGDFCDTAVPCCDILTDTCDPIQGICIDVTVVDAGSNNLPGVVADGVSWVSEFVQSNGTTVIALSVASSQVAAAIVGGTDLLVLGADAGWYPIGTVPSGAQLGAVWVDAEGDLLAVGQVDAGSGAASLFVLEGTVSGVEPVSPGSAALGRLDAVLGLGPHEALLSGTSSDGGAAVIVHLEPDGGVVPESLPNAFAIISKLTANAAGQIFALGSAYQSNLPVEVLERLDGGWSAVPAIYPVDGGFANDPQLVSLANVYDLAVGPAGDLTLVGDDGDSHGLIYVALDGGFSPMADVPSLPSVIAVTEPVDGVLYFALGFRQPEAAGIVSYQRDVGGSGTWNQETVPASTLQINVLASDPNGDAFAGGFQVCADCAGSPVILRRTP